MNESELFPKDNTDDILRDDKGYAFIYCESCSAVNWYLCDDGYTVNNTSTEAVKCWKCNHLGWTNSYDKDIIQNINHAHQRIGMLDPVLPVSVLRYLLDAAEEQIKELDFLLRDGEDASVLDGLRYSAKLVAGLLKEKQEQCPF